MYFMLSWSSEKYGTVVVDFQNSQDNYYLFWKQDTLQKAGDQETSQSKLTFTNQRIKIIKALHVFNTSTHYQLSNTEFNK